MSDDYKLESTGGVVVIADLGIRLKPNEAAWVSRGDMQASECLRALVRLEKVRVSSGARSRVSKDPIKKRMPTAVLRTRPNSRGVPASPATPKTGLSAEEAQVMADRAAKAAAEKAVAAVTAQFQQMLATASLQPAAPQPNIADTVAQAVTQALQSVSVPIAAQRPSSDIDDLIAGGPDEPLFIPTGIVKDTSESLSVSSESSTSGGLDDAANALKALRKSK